VVDEFGPLAREVAHVDLELSRDPVDRDEQCQLSRTQRVEELTVVPAHHDLTAVGDQSYRGKIVSLISQGPHRGERTRRWGACVEQRSYNT